MAKHQQRSSSRLWIVGSILGIGLLIWGLAALGNRSAGNTAAGSKHGTKGSGTAIYLTSSPAVTTNLINPGKKTILWFSATWCEICERMSPYVQSVVERHADRVVITERDVDREPALARQYAVRGTPTFVLLDESGKAVSTRVGYLSETQFESFITQGI